MNTEHKTGKTILYLNNLSEKITEADLRNFFKDFQEDIHMIEINHNYENCSALNLITRAFVIFKTEEKAKEAFNALSMKKLYGRTMYIQYHKEQILTEEKGNNLFVKGLPLYTPPREIFEKFLEYGDIISSKLCEDEDGNHLGYGYFNYSQIDSVNKILNEVSNNKRFFGAPIQVAMFKKKIERDFRKIKSSKLKNIYIKNLPEEYTEEDLLNQFSKYGNIEFKTVKSNKQYKTKYAIVSYENEEFAKNAIFGENEKNGIYVDYLQTKAERKRILANKVIVENIKLSTQYKKSNLHIRNLPKEIKEENLAEILKKYGEIRSLKIPKYILVSKINDRIIETTQSRLFGYACFENEEEASIAIRDLNGKKCPGFEGLINRPLIVEYFMPRQERRKYLSSIYNTFDNKKFFFNPSLYKATYFSPLSLHPELAKHVRRKGPNLNNPMMLPKPKENIQPPIPRNQRHVDLKYVNSLKSEEERHEYLGEILYYNIQNNRISIINNFNVDIIGKITGMILGIEDLNEKCDIINQYDNLTQQIIQAAQLLGIDVKTN